MQLKIPIKGLGIKMTDSKLIDTSVWLDYLFKDKYKEIIDLSETVLISSLTIFEIRRKMLKDKLDHAAIEAAMLFVDKKSLIEPVSTDIAELAAQLSDKHQLAAADSIIYATAQHRKVQLITRDNDFRGLPGVVVVS